MLMNEDTVINNEKINQMRKKMQNKKKMMQYR